MKNIRKKIRYYYDYPNIFAKAISSKIIKRKKTQLPFIIKKKKKDTTVKLTHISAFNYGNAGDILLPRVVRDSIEACTPYRYSWKGYHTSQEIKRKELSSINKSKALIIGGGGLFLKDTNPNNNSGWQWSCPINTLKQIQVPIVIYAVGYNRFRGQDDFEDIFHKHVNLLASKATFIGLRNSGSIENMKKYILPEFHQKIVYQPCPTTVISNLYPQVAPFLSERKNIVAINCAFDRSFFRFGNQLGNKLSSIAKIAKHLSKENEIVYYSHMPQDKAFLPFLDAYNVSYKVCDIDNMSLKEVVKVYTQPKLVIGMRGHAQMIPFGCNTPILSILSHDKMRWFLDDIGHNEFGIELLDENFEELLHSKAEEILANNSTVLEELREAQLKLWNITTDNTYFLLKSLNINV